MLSKLEKIVKITLAVSGFAIALFALYAVATGRMHHLLTFIFGVALLVIELAELKEFFEK
jgi:hypothetical protein